MRYNAVSSRYEKIWDGYLSELTLKPNLSIRSYLRSHRVSMHCYENWMSRHGHSAKQAKAHAKCLQAESQERDLPVTEGPSFAPVILREESPSGSHSCDILIGISLTLPDGTVISIRRGSAEAVVSFLKLYSGEESSCSD